MFGVSDLEDIFLKGLKDPSEAHLVTQINNQHLQTYQIDRKNICVYIYTYDSKLQFHVATIWKAGISDSCHRFHGLTHQTEIKWSWDAFTSPRTGGSPMEAEHPSRIVGVGHTIYSHKSVLYPIKVSYFPYLSHKNPWKSPCIFTNFTMTSLWSKPSSASSGTKGAA